MHSSLEIALSLRQRGLSVIPVPPPRAGVPPGQVGDGKTPAIPWKEFQSRPPTEDEIRQWFSGGSMNIAIITGAISGIVVVDVDSMDALRWWTSRRPYTPWQTGTSQGFHLAYRHPGVPIRNRARLETPDGRLAIDVRGDGGYAIAPGSTHPSGVEYQWAGDWSVSRDQLPRFWPGWLQRPTRPSAPRPDRPRPTGNVVERARRYLAAIPPPMIGYGSDNATLYAACKLTRGFELNALDAEALLWEWAGHRPGWTREWIAQKVAHAIRYGSEPIGVLR